MADYVIRKDGAKVDPGRCLRGGWRRVPAGAPPARYAPENARGAGRDTRRRSGQARRQGYTPQEAAQGRRGFAVSSSLRFNCSVARAPGERFRGDDAKHSYLQAAAKYQEILALPGLDAETRQEALEGVYVAHYPSRSLTPRRD